MLAVALVAVAVAGGQRFVTLRARSQFYQIAADVYGAKSQAAGAESELFWIGAGAREAAKKSAAWNARRPDIYKEAAARPWRDVPTEAEPTAVSDGNKAVSDGNDLGPEVDAALERLRTGIRQVVRPGLYR